MSASATTLLTTQVINYLPLRRQIELLAMSPAMRKKLLRRVATEVVKRSRKRIKTQTDLHGQPFADRSVGRDGRRSRRRMLAGLGRKMAVTKASGTSATVGWRSRLTGRIAAQQQHGMTETLTTADLPKAPPSAADSPATRGQARALILAGFKVKKASGKGKRRPSQKWIMQHMTVGGAGVALKNLREWAGQQAKKSWQTRLPARSFLGASQEDIAAHVDQITRMFLQELNHGIR